MRNACWKILWRNSFTEALLEDGYDQIRICLWVRISDKRILRKFTLLDQIALRGQRGQLSEDPSSLQETHLLQSSRLHLCHEEIEIWAGLSGICRRHSCQLGLHLIERLFFDGQEDEASGYEAKALSITISRLSKRESVQYSDQKIPTHKRLPLELKHQHFPSWSYARRRRYLSQEPALFDHFDLPLIQRHSVLLPSREFPTITKQWNFVEWDHAPSSF